MVTKLMKEIRESQPKDGSNWFGPKSGGYGEDNNMTVYKWDILFTRLKFRKVADNQGFKRPYHFKRRDFRWKEDKHKEWISYYLMGKLVLIDSKGNELVSNDMEWMDILDPQRWQKWRGEWISKNHLFRYITLRTKNKRIWDYITKKRKENESNIQL